MDWKNLKAFTPRSFLSLEADLSKVLMVEHYFKLLEARPINSLIDLEQWLIDRSELEAAFSQAGSILYIEMTCHTDDDIKSAEYTSFIQTILPIVKPYHDRLNRKFLEATKDFTLPSKRYDVYLQSIKTDIELFRHESIPLQTKVELLSQEYQTVSGAMTVDFKGQEYTMPQLSKFQLENDSSLREAAWHAGAQRRLKDKDKIESVFEQMFVLRNSIAQNAGFKNFIDYQYKAYHRFDYTPLDCKKFHESVEQLIVPLVGEILTQRKKEMKVSSLRPWDLAVDPLGRRALKPFNTAHELTRGVQKIFDKLDKGFSQQFLEMQKSGLLDLESRKGKAPGGYQNTLSEARVPFIFMNSVGVDDDVRTLLHEAGHAFHALAAAHEPLLDYRHAPMEFCEVASMAMELIGGKYLNVFYGREDLARSHKEHLEGIIQTLAWVATIDAFQHWLYEHPGHSCRERQQAWVGFYLQFGGKFIDWTDLEEVRAFIWHRQLHVFEVPFYYIEYGIAQLGALQLWVKSQKGFAQVLNDYRKGLALGGAYPLPQLYQASGIKFDFSQETIAPLVQAVFNEWKKYNG